MSELKAIETRWNGILFRSRLEARWAVFFDRLSVKYLYEAETYSLPPIPGAPRDAFGDGIVWYLPDFLLPKQQRFPDPLWVEVKGVSGPAPQAKLERLVFHSDQNGVVVQAIQSAGSEGFDIIRRPSGEGTGQLGWDSAYFFCQCCNCGAVGFEFGGRSERIGCACEEKTRRQCSYDAADIINACDAALSERFGT